MNAGALHGKEQGEEGAHACTQRQAAWKRMRRQQQEQERVTEHVDMVRHERKTKEKICYSPESEMLPAASHAAVPLLMLDMCGDVTDITGPERRGRTTGWNRTEQRSAA